MCSCVCLFMCVFPVCFCACVCVCVCVCGQVKDLERTWHIELSDITFKRKLDSGAFGDVRSASDVVCTFDLDCTVHVSAYPWPHLSSTRCSWASGQGKKLPSRD